MIQILDDIPCQKISQLTCSRNLFTALSHLFSGGGENLTNSLFKLAERCLQSEKTYPDLYNLGSNLATYAQANDIEQKQMCYEFNRLFVGPTPPIAPPYESVYLSEEHLLMQEQTIQVRRIYQSENLMTNAQGMIPDDFIGTELEFAAYLLTRAIEAFSAGKDAEGAKYLSVYQMFMQEHPRRWLPEFAATVSQNTCHPVFSVIVQVLLNTIEISLENDQKED